MDQENGVKERNEGRRACFVYTTPGRIIKEKKGCCYLFLLHTSQHSRKKIARRMGRKIPPTPPHTHTYTHTLGFLIIMRYLFNFFLFFFYSCELLLLFRDPKRATGHFFPPFGFSFSLILFLDSSFYYFIFFCLFRTQQQ